MAFTNKDVMELRQKTGTGIMDCKEALTESGGNMEKAIEYLRMKGMATAGKKAGRIAGEGIVHAYIHADGAIGVLVEINCETDFVARSDDFKEFAHNIALQIAAYKPLYVSSEEVEQHVIDNERKILIAQAIDEGAKPEFADRMVEGRLKKYLKDICLLEQEYIKNPSLTIAGLLNETVGKLGEKITIRRFTKYEMGEGIEKKADNFVAEVNEQVAKMTGGAKEKAAEPAKAKPKAASKATAKPAPKAATKKETKPKAAAKKPAAKKTTTKK